MLTSAKTSIMDVREKDERFFGRGNPRVGLEITKTVGSHVFDAKGRKYVDFLGGAGVGILGWEVEEIETAIRKNIRPTYVYPNFFYERWAELAEMLDLIDRHVLVAGEVEERIEQHRAVAGRQDEAVAVGPVRVFRIEFQEAREQDRGKVGAAHRQAGMARIGLLDGVHGKEADRVRHPVVLFA